MMNPNVDFFFNKQGKWQEEYQKLREIILGCDLKEELKWGCPCYTLNGKNVVLIHGFKEYCALLFHKGVLLKDKKGILVQQTENVQSARQMRFTNLKEIMKLEDQIRAFIREAIEVQKAGKKVEFKRTSEYEMPEELQRKMETDPAFRDAFNSLTPGRQRGYILHFSGAKQSRTREDRIEKCLPQIMEGRGLNDR